MPAESGLAGERTKVETIAAAGIQDHIALRWGDHLFDRPKQGFGDTSIVQPSPRGNGRSRVAGLLRSPILRLEQIDVSASGDIEGMPAFTKQPPQATYQGQAAIANGTLQHAWPRAFQFCRLRACSAGPSFVKAVIARI
jgi:hypothetical protein